MNWLRNKLRAWLGVAVATVAVDEKPSGMSIAQQLFAQAGERFLVHRKLEPPKLPPNVRDGFVYDINNDPGKLGAPCLAYDDATNAPMWAYLNQANCGLGFPGYPYLAELSQRSEYRNPTETLASEATREWIDITVKGKASRKKREERGEEIAADEELDEGLEDRIERLEAALEKFCLRDHFRKLSEVDGLFGRAQLFIDVDQGGDPDEVNQLPLVVDKATIKQASVKGFKVVEPIWTSPYAYNTSNPTKPDFYKPRAWFVIGKRVHASRLLTFIGREVPDMLKPAYNFGGLSMSQLMEPYVFQWLRTRNSVSDLIHNFSVMCLKTDMAAVLSGDQNAGMGLLDRAKFFTQTRDNQGLTLLDKTREEMEVINVPLSTLDKLQAQSQEHMAAVCQEPLVKLTGITPSGLNASSEGEIQVWYDRVRSYQIAFYAKHLKHVVDIVQLDEFGDIDESISFEFRALSSPTVKELAEIRKANAETDNTYVAMGAISPEEVRERVQADPESGYNNLSGPAPPPPAQLDAEHAAGVGEEGKQLDHERSQETAEEDHKRALELEKQKAKAKPKAA
jgi:phage-related protein (TIGR01555 family)